jgi:hypothetical protein
LLFEKMPALAPRTAQAKAFAHLLTIKCFLALRHVVIGRGALGVMLFGKMPACLKDGRSLRDNFIIGGCFPIIAGNATVCSSSLSFTGEAAAGPLAVRRLERVKAAHSQSSGEVALLCVSRGRIALCVM